MSYYDPYFSSKLGKMYSFDPPPFFFFTLVAFRVDGRWGREEHPYPKPDQVILILALSQFNSIIFAVIWYLLGNHNRNHQQYQ